MIAELGHFALILALALALLQSSVPFVGAWRNDGRLTAVAGPVALTQFLFVGLAFAALVHAHMVSDFSLLNVVENSHSQKPLLYKITGVWGNHEGSMLLWVLILALFGALVAAFGRNLPERLKALVLSVQGWIAAAFLLFILVTSNPFLRLDPAPAEGNDLNPVLQDIGLAIHPPLLYLGYVGCSISFAFAVAALIEGRIDAAWARWVRPWTLTAWIFLTLGIAMGSYWAYYELGWGGFWFWDPVENASLMPWLAVTALLHSAVVMEKRDALKIWTLLLAILAFSLSLIGTFLVRSGVLTSVHAFATDPTRGVFILGILVLFIGGALTLFALRAGGLAPGGIFAPISREGALVLNNLFLTAAAATVIVGTLYPLVLEALTGERISVGPPFFNLTFGPLVVPLLVLVPFGPMLAWKRGDVLAAAQRLFAAFAVALAAAVLAAMMSGGTNGLALLGVALGVWLIAGALVEIATRVRLFGVPPGDSLRRLVGLPRSAIGTAIAHFGLGLSVLGIVVASAWSTETILTMRPGEGTPVSGYTVTLDGYRAANGSVSTIPLLLNGPNYQETVAHFSVRSGGTLAAAMEPSKRAFAARETVTTESAIATFWPSQLYISLGDIAADGAATVRIYWKPAVTLIWLGAVVMALGGAFSLSDRRLRIGAPRPARPGILPAPAE
ncbi:MAG TPA: heme lyase CcmF/NrfE family subunit [Bauldia sp.]|nr:heme lyase CcmF/NrfE family subunit [Bauldia sp.]